MTNRWNNFVTIKLLYLSYVTIPYNYYNVHVHHTLAVFGVSEWHSPDSNGHEICMCLHEHRVSYNWHNACVFTPYHYIISLPIILIDILKIFVPSNVLVASIILSETWLSKEFMSQVLLILIIFTDKWDKCVYTSHIKQLALRR